MQSCMYMSLAPRTGVCADSFAVISNFNFRAPWRSHHTNQLLDAHLARGPHDAARLDAFAIALTAPELSSDLDRRTAQPRVRATPTRYATTGRRRAAVMPVTYGFQIPRIDVVCAGAQLYLVPVEVHSRCASASDMWAAVAPGNLILLHLLAAAHGRRRSLRYCSCSCVPVMHIWSHVIKFLWFHKEIQHSQPQSDVIFSVKVGGQRHSAVANEENCVRQ